MLLRPTGRRYFEGISNARIVSHPGPEAVRLALVLLGRGRYSGRSPQMMTWMSKEFDRGVSRSLDGRESAIYGYEDCAYQTFLRAKDVGIKTIYELPIAYYAVGQESQRPELRSYPGVGRFMHSLTEPDEKLRRKDRELDLADLVVCASSYVKRTLLEHRGISAPISVIPYGVDLHECCRTSTATISKVRSGSCT